MSVKNPLLLQNLDENKYVSKKVTEVPHAEATCHSCFIYLLF